MASVALLSHPDCRKHEMGTHHPECPERLDAIFDYLLATGLLDYVQQHEAPLATDAQILLAHTQDHLDSVMARAPQTGYAAIDGDTTMNAHTLIAARRAAGAAVHAVDRVMQGDVMRAFCAVRPPGHHAQSNRAMGFCIFNNAAIAVRHAVRTWGAQRVALIDFDVHHGNGSEEILADDPNVLMLSTFQRNLYPYSGTEPLGGNMVNVPLAAYSRGDAMRSAVENHWLPAIANFQPELIVISAGFDAHRDDELAMLGWTEADYRWVTDRIVEMANQHSGGRIVSTLEGGYALDALARSVAEHVKGLLQI
jgi:acetoin utilization deacetylase AcuC-like enzyme